MRLPRPCRFLARRFVLSSEVGIGQPLSGHLAHGQMEAVGVIKPIIFCRAIVEPEDLLCYVAVKVKRLDGNIGSAKATLQQAPEVLDPLSVNLTANVFLDVIDRFVNVLPSCEVIVSRMAICVDGRAALDLIQYFVLKSLALDVRDNLGRGLGGSHDQASP